MKPLSIVLSVGLTSAIAPQPMNAADAVSALSEHPAVQLETWKDWLERGSKERVAAAPAVVLDFLRKDNELQGWNERPDAENIKSSFVNDTVSALENMPSEVLKHFADHAVGVFLVSNLGGSAYAELLKDYQVNKRGFIVLDVGSLARAANEWATWRERSPFVDGNEVQLVAKIEPDQRNDRSEAIRYILLHEIGHLVGAVQRHHGSWRETSDPAAFPFSVLSWARVNGKTVGKTDDRFARRAAVYFYKFNASKLTSSDIEPVYREFANSDFVSLFASTNPFDDFAETYAMYAHVILQGKPWSVQLRKAGSVIMDVDRPILKKRCQLKRQYFDRLFGR
jgi:hypothetical protein